MPVDGLQRSIATLLRENRDRLSAVGGSSVFNATFPRRSDDIDLYTHLKIGDVAAADIRTLREAGLNVQVNDQFYGYCVEVTVSDGAATTKIEWNEADRERFFPTQPDALFGWTLHKTDLAIQKPVAAASQRTARDAVDVMLIDCLYVAMEPLAIAAPAKVGNVSPLALLDRVLRNAMERPAQDYERLDLEREAMPFAIGDLKLILSDRIALARSTILDQCPTAVPGLLYTERGSTRAAIPTLAAIGTCDARPISERGAIPMIDPDGTNSDAWLRTSPDDGRCTSRPHRRKILQDEGTATLSPPGSPTLDVARWFCRRRTADPPGSSARPSRPS